MVIANFYLAHSPDLNLHSSATKDSLQLFCVCLLIAEQGYG